MNEIRPTFMFPVGVQLFVVGSYSSARVLYEPPPATSTRPSARRTAIWMPAGSLNVPAGSQVAVVGSYSSAVETWAPPTVRADQKWAERPIAVGVTVIEASAAAQSVGGCC